jgi:hypothetical protein
VPTDSTHLGWGKLPSGSPSTCSLNFGELQVHGSQPGTSFRGTLKHADLVAQSQVLQLKGRARTENRGQGGEEHRERNGHRRRIKESIIPFPSDVLRFSRGTDGNCLCYAKRRCDLTQHSSGCCYYRKRFPLDQEWRFRRGLSGLTTFLLLADLRSGLGDAAFYEISLNLELLLRA